MKNKTLCLVKLMLLVTFFVTSFSLLSQQFSISGTVVDTNGLVGK